MKFSEAVSKAKNMGDFYLYYNKYKGKGSTYLVGTTDFNNKYILEKAKKYGSGLHTTVTEDTLQGLLSIQKLAETNNKIMLFSWTNDKFRFLDSKDVRRLTPLATELRNARNKR